LNFIQLLLPEQGWCSHRPFFLMNAATSHKDEAVTPAEKESPLLHTKSKTVSHLWKVTHRFAFITTIVL
jgi:hypothetical protein